jgi:uracil-DNA glycosylase
MNLNERSKKLIKQHYGREQELNFDGAIDENSYKDSKIKILYILKESWGNDRNYSIVDELNKAIYNGGKFETKSAMFDRLAEWTYGILNDCDNYDEVVKNLKENNESYQKPLCQVAYINISKEITPNSTTKDSKLKKILKKNKELIKKQIELFNPDVIITCGIWGEYGIADEIAKIFKMDTDWLDGGANGATIINVNCKKVGLISMLHPAARANGKDEFNMLMSGWKNIKKDILCINCEKTLEENKKIFEKLGFKNDSSNILNYDGYICKEMYEKATVKVVFILKESYTNNKEEFKNEYKSSITYLLCDVLSKNNKNYFGKETGSTKMFNTLGIMANYLLYGKEDIHKNHWEIQRSLLNVAYLNISKEPLERQENDSKESDATELEKKFEKYKDLLKVQIEELKPDIVVACGKIGKDGIFGKIVEEIFNEKLNSKDIGETKISINGEDVKFLFSYHPSYTQSYENFIKQLKEKLEELNK